jgi:DNA-binding beta-propeller fold protein YncE
VTVVDLDKDSVIGDITGFTSVHGIALAPKLGLGYISDGKGNKVSIFDLKTQKVTKTVDTGSNPDWIMYEASTNEVYVCNGNSHTITAFDAVSGNVTATVDLAGGKPETAMVDPKAGQLYDNLENKFSMAVIDLKTHKMVANWLAVAGKGASGLAIDLAHHKLFLACADDAAPTTDLLAMMDSTSGKVVATLPCAKGVDASAFDPATQYAFAPGGDSGTLTIAKEDGDKLTLVQTLATATGAKTLALDPTTHNIYVACVKYQAAATPAPAAASGSARARPARPAPVADSFRVLVYGMDAAK